MYTEIFFRATLVKDLPDEVLAPIRAMLGEIEVDPDDLPDHPLFECQRWDMLARCSSYYFPGHLRSVLVMDDILKAWALGLNADIKNYDGEIDKFFDWIDPYVDAGQGEFLGYSLYEDVDPNTGPQLYYKK
jgi:hypothetical protein